MRLGGPTFQPVLDPDQWIKELRSLGYQAAFCPIEPGLGLETIKAYQRAAAQANIVIAEVGAWSNPIATDPELRKVARQKCFAALDLAEQIGARCCVNISGSCGAEWDGPHVNNFSTDTFDLVVETVRDIIDTVRPQRTVYCLETMPWMIPDTLESYSKLISAIDRRAFAVHFDPVNLMTSPRTLAQSGKLIRQAFQNFGDRIASCHLKDAIQLKGFPVHIQEVAPGKGSLDYITFLQCAAVFDLPMMLEHLESPAEYATAATHIRAIACQQALEWQQI